MKVPKKYYDEIFEFAGRWGQPSACGLKIVEKNGQTLVMVTELYQDNPGTSVTAAGSSLALQICEKKGLLLPEVIYLECTPDTDSVLSFYGEAHYEVTFAGKDGQIMQQPAYRRLSVEEIRALGLYAEA
jgi:hypothetical protein